MEGPSDLRKIFRKYDRENKGYIVEQDIENIAKSVGENLNEVDIKDLFQTLDRNKKGKVTFEDFCSIMHHPQSL